MCQVYLTDIQVLEAKYVMETRSGECGYLNFMSNHENKVLKWVVISAIECILKPK